MRACEHVARRVGGHGSSASKEETGSLRPRTLTLQHLHLGAGGADAFGQFAHGLGKRDLQGPRPNIAAGVNVACPLFERQRC